MPNVDDAISQDLSPAVLMTVTEIYCIYGTCGNYDD